LPVFLLFSVFLLFRGHNLPGGGFVGGLVAASGFTLYALAQGPEAVRKALRLSLKSLVGIGLLLAVLSGMIAVGAGGAFLTGLWTYLRVGQEIDLHLGTPLIFDIGVFFVVFGTVLTIVLAQAEE
jgi:multicomponent Na+:H+ antiporter subunit B